MEQEIVLTEKAIKNLPVTTLSKRTLSILVNSTDYAGRLAMVQHYSERNYPKFTELLKIRERIPDLVKSVGTSDMGKIIMVEITKFINCYTVVRPMNADQIAQCAFALISTSEEDNLSLQDLVVFFEGAKQGKYGRVLDHIDQHTIFEMLEQYRNERHRQYLHIKEENDVQFKGLGDRNRTSDEYEAKEVDVRKHMVDYYKDKIIKEKENGK
jgi:hypothetical protein